MHQRYYSNQLARFVSVDPVQGQVGSSQSWNRYSYVLNNPINLIDPYGLAPDDDLGWASKLLRGFLVRFFEDPEDSEDDEDDQRELLEQAEIGPDEDPNTLGTGAGENIAEGVLDAHVIVLGELAEEGTYALAGFAAGKMIRFGGGFAADSAIFHRQIKPQILKAAGNYRKTVGHTPDVKVVDGLIQLVGSRRGPFKGKTLETGLKASDFF